MSGAASVSCGIGNRNCRGFGRSSILLVDIQIMRDDMSRASFAVVHGSLAKNLSSLFSRPSIIAWQSRGMPNRARYLDSSSASVCFIWLRFSSSAISLAIRLSLEAGNAHKDKYSRIFTGNQREKC
ncbi:hypothetical protein Adt_01374 [Abeliophyllum distichum]|uniref:Uncharacterized protein n=1 Tax=Abeliophyllum distichum TaxID=126358 RepID=A0ABD1NR75_9LAMI